MPSRWSKGKERKEIMNKTLISNELVDASWDYDELNLYMTEIEGVMTAKYGAMAAIKLENFRKAVLAMRIVCDELKRGKKGEGGWHDN